ncbi:MAG: hypothetical protein HFG20_11435 [Anaerotruncus sp.]|nr:hypothetical protein [Anaerotruncus sp.]
MKVFARLFQKAAGSRGSAPRRCIKAAGFDAAKRNLLLSSGFLQGELRLVIRAARGVLFAREKAPLDYIPDVTCGVSAALCAAGKRSGCPAYRSGSRAQAHGDQIYDLAPRLREISPAAAGSFTKKTRFGDHKSERICGH